VAEGRHHDSNLLDPDSATEQDRLDLVEQEQDPATTALLKRLGLAPDWDCLEVGAGAGSIAYWLADHCPGGRVVATDRTTRQLDSSAHPNLEIVQADITDVEFSPESFHLVHARAVLTHVPDRQLMIQRMIRWLRPNGWLVVTDPASFTVASSPYPLIRKAGAAATAVARRMIGTDPNWARTFPRPLIEAGLADVDAECRLRMMRGGTREAVMMDLMYEQFGKHMEATGLITADELAEVRALLRDPNYVDLPPAVIRSWGRRPATHHGGPR
jgi:2-polyprenyl-3-methyl-5-hydroxy-6-metoxy-1,4-benzoquinol methylase